MGGGKALKNGSKVLTPSGWVNIEDLKIGDKITSPSNNIETVTGVFPQGEVPLNLITFQDGRQSVCCDDHLWSVRSVSGIKKDYSILKTSELRKDLEDGKKYKIPLPKPLDLPPTKKVIHPYLMGAVLGDGCLRTIRTCPITTEDSFIVDKLRSLGYTLHEWKCSGRTKSYNVSKMRKHFDSIGLGGVTSHTKFIPKEYLSGSKEDRLSLVQGLMDTDGYVCKRGRLRYYTSSLQLAKDFTYLVRSLGAYASLNKKWVKYKGDRVLTYDVYFRAENPEIFVSIPRKLERVRPNKIANGLRIESIEPQGKGQATCISVTGDKLFITDDFVVTHNTFASLIDNTQGIHDPDYKSVFIRTTTTEIDQGLWPDAKGLYMKFLTDDGTTNGRYLGKAHIDEKRKIITFPSGATTAFAYLQNDEDTKRFFGSELAKVYFEEAQFRSWRQFTILLSRNRSRAQVTKGIRCTLNPDDRSWIFDFVRRYLDDEGYPIRKLSGKTAYYYIKDGKLYTSWNKKSLKEEFNLTKDPLSYTYIPAKLSDNKKLLELDPDYQDVLAALPEVERKRYEDGCWLDTGQQGLYFKRDWLRPAPSLPKGCSRVRGYDLAASEKTPTTYPDFTVGIGMAKDREGNFYIYGNYVRDFKDDDSDIHGCFRKSSGTRDQIMLTQAMHDGKDCEIVMPQDAGAAGKESFQHKVKFFLSHGFKVRKDPAGHTARKGEKAESFLTACEHGFVYIVRDSFTPASYDWLMGQLEVFNPNEKSTSSYKDDAMDACASGFNYLNSKINNTVQMLPDINSPTLKSQLGI